MNEYDFNKNQNENGVDLNAEVKVDSENIEHNNEHIQDVNFVIHESEKAATVEKNANETNVHAPFYKETYVKQNKPKSSNGAVLFSGLVGSIAGALIVSIFLTLVVPFIDSPLRNAMNNLYQNDSGIYTSEDENGSVKKIEISETPVNLVTAVAEKAGPTVVGIKTTSTSTQDFFGMPSNGGVGEGSGIIIRSNGYVITNYHVIEGAVNENTRKIAAGGKVEVIITGLKEKTYAAKVVGFDSKTDLAVIKIDATNLPFAEYGNSDNLKIGETVVAIGNPGGLEYSGSVTTGVISGLNRRVDLDNGKKMSLIQTDAAINPGNSGGALLNSKGQLIGVNSVKLVAQGFEGLGFAIPVNKVKEITDSLILNKYVTGRPLMGVTINQQYTPEIAKQNNLPEGLYVDDVTIMGAAFRAGIKQGDIITKLNNVKVKIFDELETEKNKHKPGDIISVEVYRVPNGELKGSYKTFKMTLQEDKG